MEKNDLEKIEPKDVEPLPTSGIHVPEKLEKNQAPPLADIRSDKAAQLTFFESAWLFVKRIAPVMLSGVVTIGSLLITLKGGGVIMNLLGLLLQAAAPVTTSTAGSEILVLLNPLVVALVAALVRKFFPDLHGWVVVGIVVPLLSVGAALVSQVVLPTGASFFLTFVVGLVGTFIREALKQLGQGNDSNRG